MKLRTRLKSLVNYSSYRLLIDVIVFNVFILHLFSEEAEEALSSDEAKECCSKLTLRYIHLKLKALFPISARTLSIYFNMRCIKFMILIELDCFVLAVDTVEEKSEKNKYYENSKKKLVNII